MTSWKVKIENIEFANFKFFRCFELKFQVFTTFWANSRYFPGLEKKMIKFHLVTSISVVYQQCPTVCYGDYHGNHDLPLSLWYISSVPLSKPAYSLLSRYFMQDTMHSRSITKSRSEVSLRLSSFTLWTIMLQRNSNKYYKELCTMLLHSNDDSNVCYHSNHELYINDHSNHIKGCFQYIEKTISSKCAVFHK